MWYGSEAVDHVMQGVEEVVDEIVDGSRKVVQCLSLGMMFIAAIAVVRMGYFILAVLTDQVSRIPRCKPRKEKSWYHAGGSIPDAFGQRYGGRLRGGMKQSQGLSVKEIFGSRPDPVAKQKPIELHRVKEGDIFSLIYSRGSRAGKRRVVKLLKLMEVVSGSGVKGVTEKYTMSG